MSDKSSSNDQNLQEKSMNNHRLADKDAKIITIPSTMKSITENQFSDYLNLEEVCFEAGSNLETIGSNAFSGCSNLKSIEIPSSVIRIKDCAFLGCTNLSKCTFSEGSKLTTIGAGAYLFCSSITNIDIPPLIKNIGDTAFSNCDNLKTVVFKSLHQNQTQDQEQTQTQEPNQTQGQTQGQTQDQTQDQTQELILGNQVFYQCEKLSSIHIPSFVVSLGEYAFFQCNNLEECTFQEPSKITSIQKNTFSHCINLQTINIPSSVRCIASNAFFECTKLESVTITNNSQLESIQDKAFYLCSRLTTVNIPPSVKSIGNCAFYDCQQLQDINFERVEVEGTTALEKIEANAFEFCITLKTVRIPSSVESINRHAFANCQELALVEFEDIGKSYDPRNDIFEGSSKVKRIAVSRAASSNDAIDLALKLVKAGLMSPGLGKAGEIREAGEIKEAGEAIVAKNCSICFEAISINNIKLSCLHFYHRECIVGWLEDHNTCCECRAVVQNEFKESIMKRGV